jgi:hypothetical protein
MLISIVFYSTTTIHEYMLSMLNCYLTRAKKYDDCALASISCCLLGLITLPLGDMYVSSFSAGKNCGDKPNSSFAGIP